MLQVLSIELACLYYYNYFRLLDMGFEKDVSSVLQAIKDKVPSNSDFQTVLMSATLNKGE